MAYPVTGKWSDLIIKLGDGATPTETFTPSCVLRTDKGVSMQTTTSEVMMVDCSSANSEMIREAVALSYTISGTGLMDFAEFDDWRAWAQSLASKNLQIEYALSAANNGGYFEGPFILETFEQRGNRTENGGRIMATVNIVSAGAVSWTNAAA